MEKETSKAENSLFAHYPEVLGVKDISLMLGVSTGIVYQLVKDGTLQRIPCSHTIKVAKISLINYVLQSAQI